MPAIEAGGKERRAAAIHSLVTHVPESLQLIFVVLGLDQVLITCRGTDSWCPEEERKDVLRALPAFALLVIMDNPAARVLHEVLCSQNSVDYECFG